jgi:guanine deaminase
MQAKDLPQPGSTNFSNRQLPIATLLYLATLGGAEVCCLEKEVGSLAPGKSFDALLVDVRSTSGNPGLWGMSNHGGNRLDGMLEQFLFCGDDRNISRVFVQGKLIGGKHWYQ